MLATRLFAASLMAIAATSSSAQTHYDATPIPGAASGFQRVVFTPVIDVVNGYSKSSCYSQAYCSRRDYDYLFVTPCPVGKPCGANGYYTRGFGSFVNCPNSVPCGADTLDLKIGTQYSFFGNWIIERYFNPLGATGCTDMLCFFGEDYATGTYPSSSTPVIRVSWGTVRARYR